MVAPFKAYSKNINLTRRVRNWDGTIYTCNTYRLTAYGSKQKPPYVNTAYTANIYEYIHGLFTDAASWSVSPGGADTRTFATNKARAKFVSALGDASQLGSTLTSERKATYDTVVGGIASMLRSANQLRKGNLYGAALALGASPPERKVKTVRRTRKGKITRSYKTVIDLPDGRSLAKTVGNSWLWWSYGIQPLAGDVYNALDVLQRPFPWTKVEGYGRDGNIIKGPGVTHTYECKIKISANVRVKNPNLFLMNQLGLVNPVQMINEGIPFSFVFDWFSNLSQVISSFTDFVGLEIADPMTAEKSFVIEERTSPVREGKKRTLKMRTLTIPPAKLAFRYERFQWQRGANALSLLVGFLPNKVKK